MHIAPAANAGMGRSRGSVEAVFAHHKHSFNFLVLSSGAEASAAERNTLGPRVLGRHAAFIVPGSYVNYLEKEADPRARTE
jgi:hypothetical protein